MDGKSFMKDNTEVVKNILQQALYKIPQDFSLIDAKQYIKLALIKIEEVEKKRNIRQTNKEKRKNKEKISYNQNSIQIIEKMIDEERNKINKFKDEENSGDTTIFD
jgi:hypothetical protein